MTYTVGTVSRDKNDLIVSRDIGTFADKAQAMKIAKRAAMTRKDCVRYGPSSIAYIGRNITAVVAW